MKPAYPTRRKILSIAAYVILAITIAYVLVHRYPSSLAVGAIVPLADKISIVGGSPISFSSLKKPLLINFWATWCTPCQQELPILERLSKKYSDKITFVGVAVDSPREDIISTKNNLNLEYLIAEASKSVIKNWHAELLPTTYLIDLTGAIVWAHAGIIKEEELEKVLGLILKK